MPPVEPWKDASPNEKIPPSLPSSQYPSPLGVGVMPMMGLLSGCPDMSPYELTPPLAVTVPSL
jgi:hypothetical protein